MSASLLLSKHALRSAAIALRLLSRSAGSSSSSHRLFHVARSTAAKRTILPAAVSVKARPFSSSTDAPPHFKLTMPALSPTMKAGNLAVWHKKVGDKINSGDVLADVETDKATVAFEAIDEGYLAKILVPAGTKDVSVGTVVAITVDDPQDIKTFETYSADAAAPASPAAAAPAASTEAAPAAKAAAAAPSSYPSHTKLQMPALSPTMKQGNVAAWHKKEGDTIKSGDVLADVETDKATVAYESVEEGYLAKLLVPAGTKDISVGTVLAIVVDDLKDVDAFKNYSEVSGAAPAAPAAAPKPAEPATVNATAGGVVSADAPASGVRATPAAKKEAAERGVDLKQVQGTGPERRILRADVLEFGSTTAAATAKQKAPSSVTAAGAESYKDIPVTTVRQVIAQRLLQSKQTVPHYYLTVQLNVDKLLKIREQLNSRKNAEKLSVNDFIIKATALACKKLPAANSAWMETFIREYQKVDVSVAVQTDTGLITPIVFDADRLGLESISKTVKNLAAKARANKLQPAEFVGGTITVSNLGMFGIQQFNAIVNPPQACILAVGATEEKVIPAASGKESKFTTASILTCSLSADHRVVDGAVGAQWLQAFKGYIEEPITMLL